MPQAQLRAEVINARAYGDPSRRPPTEFRIFKAGTNSSEKGDFLFDDEAAASVMAAFKTKSIDISFDYDHQAMATPHVSAPAAGWCSLEVRNGELWASNIRWTPKAAAHLEAAEYRYFSPLFSFDERTGRVTCLINVALTNTPALYQLDALVAASANCTSGGTMRTSSPSDDLAIQAFIASQAGGTMPAESRAALSAVTGSASARAVLASKSDAALLAELTPEQRRHQEVMCGSDARAQAANVRLVALTALDRADREATAALVEHGRERANGRAR